MPLLHLQFDRCQFFDLEDIRCAGLGKFWRDKAAGHNQLPGFQVLTAYPSELLAKPPYPTCDRWSLSSNLADDFTIACERTFPGGQIKRGSAVIPHNNGNTLTGAGDSAEGCTGTLKSSTASSPSSSPNASSSPSPTANGSDATSGSGAASELGAHS